MDLEFYYQFLVHVNSLIFSISKGNELYINSKKYLSPEHVIELTSLYKVRIYYSDRNALSLADFSFTDFMKMFNGKSIHFRAQNKNLRFKQQCIIRRLIKKNNVK